MRIPLVAAAILALAGACAGGPAATTRPAASVSGPATAAATPAGCTGGAGVPVAIADFSFGPQSITAAVGGAVTWANGGATTHTVTFDGGPDCGRVAPGATVSRTFDTAGTFTYKCTIHSSMTGTVVVE